MAENVSNGNDEETLRDIRNLLWGNAVKEDVFKRWAQGFYFSKYEPTALVQTEGGPCAIIAPVQAFILKQLLSECDIITWSNIDPKQCDQLLIIALKEIIKQAAGDVVPRYSIVYMDCNDRLTERNEKQEEKGKDERLQQDEAENFGGDQVESESSKSLHILNSNVFHSELRIFRTNSLEEVEGFLTQQLDMLKHKFGVLVFLYTVIATKGITEIHSEMSDPMESMIDSTYGYGSQSLINLMLTGRAVSHVWDHDQNIGGLKLRGIDKQNSIGFLALLEHLRYCEVGTFLKAPSNPVWVLGSETHLTVLFSKDKRLVNPETPAEQAKRTFRRFDPEGNNFIPANLLQDVLAELGLVADSEYVEIMRKKLDNENLGIILQTAFMDEFFPEESSTCPDTFVLYHYNGLVRSNPQNRIKYQKGQAVLLECTVKCILDSNPMLTVLQTKWPRIEIQWDLGKSPSLN